MLVDQRDVAGAVVEDRRPFTAHVKMHGPVAAEVGGQTVHVCLHQVEVVAVFFQVDAAVKDVRGVGVGRHGDGVTPGSAGVDAAGARTQVKFVLVDLAGLQVDYRQRSGLPVSNQEAAHGLALVSFSFHRLLAVAVAVVIFGEGQFHQFLRFQPFRCDDHDGIRRRGVVDQLFHLRGQAAAVADDHRRFRDADAVLRSAVPGVRVAPDGNQAMHRNVVSAHLGHQVGQQGIAGDHVDGFGFRLSHLPRAALSCPGLPGGRLPGSCLSRGLAGRPLARVRRRGSAGCGRAGRGAGGRRTCGGGRFGRRERRLVATAGGQEERGCQHGGEKGRQQQPAGRRGRSGSSGKRVGPVVHCV